MGSGSLLALVARVHSFRQCNALPQRHSAAAAVVCMGSFHEDLAQRLQQLQLQAPGSAHLNWLLDAFASTLSTHSSLHQSSLHAHSLLLNQRADEVLSMLDACTSLKQVAHDVDRQLTLLLSALQNADQVLVLVPAPASSTSSAKLAGQQAAARRLQACLHGLQLLTSTPLTREAQTALLLAAKREVAPTPASQSLETLPLHQALDGTLLVSLMVLASSVAAFAPPSRSSSTAARSACKLIAAYTSDRSRSAAAPTWAAPLRKLQRDLKHEQMSAVFLEVQEIATAASSLNAAISSPRYIEHSGQLRQRIDSLYKCSQEAQTCVSLLSSDLASLFQALLTLRLALLGQH